jgi:hypothetical protein
VTEFLPHFGPASSGANFLSGAGISRGRRRCRRDLIATILQDSWWRARLCPHGMATIHCKKTAPISGAGGLKKRSGPCSFEGRARLAYHSPAQTKNDHLVITRLPQSAASFCFRTTINQYTGSLSASSKQQGHLPSPFDASQMAELRRGGRR